jgi:hypothetical protein
VYVTGGRQGGLYAGGGVGWRDTVINATSTEPRSNLLAYSLVVGATSGPAARLRTQLELRWIFLEGTTFRPIPVTLGVSLPLWRAAPSG